jgi:hypothetical protein
MLGLQMRLKPERFNLKIEEYRYSILKYTVSSVGIFVFKVEGLHCVART